MPCTTYDSTERTVSKSTLDEFDFCKASLCAVLSSLEKTGKENFKQFINNLDFEEAGVTKVQLLV